MAARFRAVIADQADVGTWHSSWNIAPTQRQPVILQDDVRGRRLGLMRWGWQPSFLAGKSLVNARGEEAHQKRTFAEAMRRRRCIVPATAFYEWAEVTNQPHAFLLKSKSLFGIAGLWETLEIDGQRQGAYLLLTVPANGLVATVHHRMAAILAPGDEDAWLDGGTDEERVRACLGPQDEEAMMSWAVDKRLNSVRNDGEVCIAPIGVQRP